MLHSSAIWVEVDVAERLCGAQSSQYQGLSVGVDDVYELGVRFV